MDLLSFFHQVWSVYLGHFVRSLFNRPPAARTSFCGKFPANYSGLITHSAALDSVCLAPSPPAPSKGTFIFIFSPFLPVSLPPFFFSYRRLISAAIREAGPSRFPPERSRPATGGENAIS